MEAPTEHPNATLVRQGLEAFNRGEMQALADLIAEDVVWHQIGAETLQGIEAMRRASPQGDVDWDIATEVHDVVANDDHAIALIEATATRADGRTLTYRTAEIMRIGDGKVTERWAFSDDTQRITEFFA